MTNYGEITAVEEMRENRQTRKGLAEAINEFSLFANGFGLKDEMHGNIKKTPKIEEGGVVIYSDELKYNPYEAIQGKGTKVTMRYRPTMEEEPSEGDNIDVEADAKQYEYGFHSFEINKATWSLKSYGELKNQQTSAPIYNDMDVVVKQQAKIWLAKEAMRKAAGITTNDFANTPTAPSANRILYGGDATGSDDLESNDIATLNKCADLISLANYRSPTVPSFEPLQRKDGIDYLWILHPWQTSSIVKSTQYLTMMAHGGVRGDLNRLFTGQFKVLMMYGNVLILTCSYIPKFTNYGADGDVNAARSLFLGRNALSFGSAMDATIVDEWKNAKSNLIKSLKLMGGWKKITPSSTGIDMGVIACDTAITPLAT